MSNANCLIVSLICDVIFLLLLWRFSPYLLLSAEWLWCSSLYICLEFVELLGSVSLLFTTFGKTSAIVLSNIFSTLSSFPSHSEASIKCMLEHLILFHRSLRYFHFLSSFFILCFCFEQFLFICLQFHWFFPLPSQLYYWAHLVNFLFNDSNIYSIQNIPFNLRISIWFFFLFHSLMSSLICSLIMNVLAFNYLASFFNFLNIFISAIKFLVNPASVSSHNQFLMYLFFPNYRP